MSNNSNDRPMTAGIYIRLSKEDRHKTNKEDDSESIINQRRMLLEYCSRNGIDVYDIYNDEDFSGSDRDRPDFNRMIDDARSKKINTVVCKTQSRFARDLEIVEKYINGLFPLWGVRFIGVVDHTDNMNGHNLKQRQISSLVDEWYISDLSANVRATLSSKRREGLWVGAFAPYGYMKDPDNKNHLIVDEEAAKIVKYVFSLYLSGIGIVSIARRLNEEGIPNPATYKKAHNQPFQNSHGECSDLWHSYSIGRMLSNEVYIGNVVQGMTENVSYKSTKKRRKDRREWDVVENVHEPIIDRETWNKAARLRENKPKPSTANGKPNVFSGKVKCGCCGGSMRVFYNRHNRYFRCSTKFISNDRCSGKYISEKVLTEAVANEIRKLYERYVDEEETAAQINMPNGLEKRLAQLKMSLQSANKEASIIDSRLESLYIDKLDGIITADEFIFLKKKFTDTKDCLVSSIGRYKVDITEVERQIGNSANKIEIVKRFKEVAELDFETVQTLIDHVEIDGTRDDRVVNIFWNI